MIQGFVSYVSCSAVGTALLFTSCASMDRGLDGKSGTKAPWVKDLQREVSALGANNWIIVSESAYPAPNHPAVRVVVADASLPAVVAEVLDSIESEGHIWPKIFTSREFDHLDEEYAPGVEKLKAQCKAAFAGRDPQVVSARTINTLVTSAMDDYRVLLVKSSSAYPYCSVFMQLDSGYWNGKSEQALRKRMEP